MKKIIILASLSLFFHILIGQNDTISTGLSGIIVNSLTQKEVPFAVISIYEKNTDDILTYSTADSVGNFSFEINQTGRFQLVIDAVGYLRYTKEFLIDKNTLQFSFGKLLLKAVDETLETVLITADKPLIRTESDKIIYNAEVDPDADNSNALELLRKVPLVSVDGEDNIRLKGKTDFKIYMNGKESVLTKTNASEFLKSLPASSIKEIEVISAPGAKYDAEGIGGIINIVTREKKISGYTLNLHANVNTLKNTQSGVSFTGALGKLVLSVNVSGGIRSKEQRTNYSENENFLNNLNRFIISDGSSDVHGNFLWGNTALSYEVDSLNLISGELQFWGGNFFNSTYSNNITNDINNILVQQYFITNETAYKYGGRSGNIDYQRTSKRNKEEILTLSYKHDSYPMTRETAQITDSIFQFINEGLQVTSKSKSNENTFQIDYVRPISDYFKAEIGSKYIMRRNTSISNEDTLNPLINLYEENIDAYVDFAHTQDIIAGYVSFNGTIKKFGYKAGIRTEYAVTNGIFKESSDTSFNNELIEYVPSCLFTYQFGKMNSIQIGYSKRIQRPGIWYLNPYVDNSNPKYVKYGNPDLISEHVHSIYWNAYFFTKIGSISFGTYYDITGNGIGSVYFLQNEDVIHETYENNIKKRTYGLNLNANLNLFKKLNVSTNITTNYNDLYSENDASVKNTSWGSYSNMNVRYSFKKSFVLSGYGGLYSFPAGLQRTSYLFYYQGITLKKSFFKDKLSLTITGSNIFWKDLSVSYDITDEYFHQSGRFTRPGRQFSFGVSYKIGEMQTNVKKARKGIRNTDLKSGGDSETGGKK